MNREPGRHWPHLFTVFCLLALVSSPAPAGDDLRGEIRFEPATQEAAWVGQEVELNLELWTNGFSFGNQLFVLPEVRGGYLVQPDSTTVKLSENRADGPWQGLRYSLLLYPQREGRLDVPSFEVKFTASAGFGAQPAAFRYPTPPLSVEARLPPGAVRGSLLVTTTAFSMQTSWTPAAPDDGPFELKVGDALRLVVTRQADAVPGMVFAPLPEFSIPGLAAYPDPPRVNDRVNRGELSGSRTDAVTFICEREGRYSLPELRFQWWDPANETLSEKIIGSRELNVSVNPAFAAKSTTGPEQQADRIDGKLLAAVLGLLIGLGYLAWRVLPYLFSPPGKAWLNERSARLRSAYRRVVKPERTLPPLNPRGLN